MKQKKMLALTLSQLKQLYRNELPEIVRIAEQSTVRKASSKAFRNSLLVRPIRKVKSSGKFDF